MIHNWLYKYSVILNNRFVHKKKLLSQYGFNRTECDFSLQPLQPAVCGLFNILLLFGFYSVKLPQCGCTVHFLIRRRPICVSYVAVNSEKYNSLFWDAEGNGRHY